MIHDDIKSNILTTKLEQFINWGRKNSFWPMPFGTACCGIEFMAVLAARTDLSRFGAEAIRFSPVRFTYCCWPDFHQNDAGSDPHL